MDARERGGSFEVGEVHNVSAARPLCDQLGERSSGELPERT